MHVAAPDIRPASRNSPNDALSGIKYGAQYGGSTTSLLNLPGESASMVTALDGHQMARTARAGAALTTAAIGFFVAAAAATVLLAIFARHLPLSPSASGRRSSSYRWFAGLQLKWSPTPPPRRPGHGRFRPSARPDQNGRRENYATRSACRSLPTASAS